MTHTAACYQPPEKNLAYEKDAVALPLERLRVDMVGQVYYFLVNEIVRIEAASSYSRLFFNNGKSVLVTRVLCRFEELLSGSGFIRVHRGHLINRNYILSCRSGTVSKICLMNGEEIPLAKRKRTVFRTVLG